TLPAAAADLDLEQREFLARLAGSLREDMTGEEVHLLVYDLAKGFPNAKPAALFQAIYVALLGKPRGPRAGFFIAALGPSVCAARFREASGQAASPSRTGGA